MRVAADVGGTFTDILLRRPDGSLSFHKVLSTPPSMRRPPPGLYISTTAWP